MTELINLTDITEYKNICKNCGAENTLWPKWVGRKRMYVCIKNEGGCGKISYGITKTEAIKIGLIEEV